MLTTSWLGRQRTLYFWTMVGFPVVPVLSSPSTCSIWPRKFGMSRARGCAWGDNHPGSGIKLSSPYVSVYHHAGASFFYKPGTVSYETQEVRAFGLFLSDLLARMDACDNDSLASTALGGIRAACLNSAPAERPRFQQIASHCHSVLEVCSLMC